MIVLIRGGGDLASGVAMRLYKAGFHVVISELQQPIAVRRKVSFAEAIYTEQVTVEGITARRVDDFTDTLRILQVYTKGQIPVLVDPQAEATRTLHPMVVVDGRMKKQPAELIPSQVKLIIGLGPGFTVGENCHVVIETKRGHKLGRVIWQGSSEPYTGIPEAVGVHGVERVLRAPADGAVTAFREIGDHLEEGQTIAEVDGKPVNAPFPGVLRGLIHPDISVCEGQKIGDIDPRDDPSYCSLISDKALAVGGGVLEAILSRAELRPYLWK